MARLRDQLEDAEQQALHRCSTECHHPILSKDPPPCGHPEPTLCEMAQRRVESLRRMIAEEEARLGA